MSAARSPGPWVPLDEWRHEVRTTETPEDALIAREEEVDEEAEAVDYAAIRDLAADKLRDYLSRIPPREALALMLHHGLLGYTPTYQDDIADVLAVRSQQVVSYMVRRARARIIYLATRPALDLATVSRVLSPSQFDVVRKVYETASFRESWRATTDETGHGHSWARTRDRRAKRTFMRALAKIDRHPELAAQSSALRHVLSHLGMLSRHEGKGVRR